MSRLRSFAVLGLGLTAGAAGHYLYAPPPLEVASLLSAWHGTAPAAERKVLYYRDPSGAPYWSATPKKDASSHDFLPVYDDEESSFEPLLQKPLASTTSTGERKVL
ncbi:MAG: efflux RND transporter periplasmic adaptor subunit, partial [Methyloceanibacter sp.]|nr:efflux RND transporter periplasmic adaptor subunit [Methyloceanibacter sp.]